VYKDARGGSELMFEGLMKRLSKEHLETFNFIMSRVRDEFFDDRKTILWLQDLPQDPESKHLEDEISRKRFTKIVFNSYWQQDKYARYLGIPYEDGVVLKNAVTPIPSHEKPKDGKIKLIYFSTPHRGLNVLEAAVRGLSQRRDDFELDVYSSFEIYGWKERDVEFKELFDRLNELKCVNYHGSVSNDKIREALKESHILAYPSIYEESSCCVAIEAMAAGCMAVVPNYGALTETCTDFAWMYNWEPDQAVHAQKYAAILNNAIDSYWDSSVQSILKMQASYYNYFYGWDMRLNEWNDMLNSIKIVS
jgi:glycosyltransferase involved in cell wall biosynthesis